MTTRHRRIAALIATIATALLLSAGACSPFPHGTAPTTPHGTTAPPTATEDPDTEEPGTETPTSAPETEEPTEAPETDTPPQGPGDDLETVTAALEKQAKTTRVDVVEVGDSYEAASLADLRHITFWVYEGGSWKEENTRSYVPTMDESWPSLRGELLSGGHHAVFVITGDFFHEARAVAFGHADGQGWSSYLAQADASLKPSNKDGDELQVKGMELNITFADGSLVTWSIWGTKSTAPYAVQFSRPTQRYWAPDGDSLRMTGSNISVAKQTEIDPIPEKLPTPGTTLGDGTWYVWINSIESTDDGSRITVQPVKGGYGECDGDLCLRSVGPPATLTLHDDAPTTLSGEKDRIVSFTAPGWVFAMLASDMSSTSQYQGVFVTGAPYVLPSSVADSILPSALFRITVDGKTITKADALYTP